MLVTNMLILSPSHGQTSTFFSSLGYNPIGITSISSDSWVGQLFYTGTNASGYLLDSIQLRMENQLGNPAGFSLSIYGDANLPRTLQPGGNLQLLTGPNPTSAGVYTFTSSGLILTPTTAYYLVATSLNPAANGSFRWDYTTDQPQGGLEYMSTGTGFAYSSDGVSWQFSRQHYFQFAINATAVPEPSSLVLLGLGGSFLFTRLSRKSRAKTLSQP